MKKITDMHSHIMPGIDDGAKSWNMSIEMISIAYQQGVRDLYLTSHSWCLKKPGRTEKYKSNFMMLETICREKYPDLKLHIGTEVLCEAAYMDEVLSDLERNIYFALDNSRYVLTEFYDYEMDKADTFVCAQALLDHGYIPVIAHVERYADMFGLALEDAKKLKSMGCLLQINLYSVAEESKQIIREFTNELLCEKLVDCVGTDAHRTTRRPPRVEVGVQVLYERCESEYVDRILSGLSYAK